MVEKKSGTIAVSERKEWLERGHEKISLNRQCALLGLARSSYYYQPRPKNELNESLMRLLDEQYTRTPFYGVLRMRQYLVNQGYRVNHKRVVRLMKKLGLVALYPGPRKQKGGVPEYKYPYLLRGLAITSPNQAWSTDITYIRMRHGFLYLVAIMDWYSRYVVAWQLSNSLDVSFCLEALDQSLTVATPEIFNSDQGTQFTCTQFISRLQAETITISMDGRGRALDNVFVERLWRSLKYEEVYLKDYETVEQAHRGIAAYFTFYNQERPHQALKYRTPSELYYGLKTAAKEKENAGSALFSLSP